MLTESFDNLVDRSLIDYGIRQQGYSVRDFNRLLDDTEKALQAMHAHPSCFDDCHTIHLRYSREQSQCARDMFYEMVWIMDYHAVYAWLSEDRSNQVNLAGLDAFRTWRPLTAPEVNDPAVEMNRALRAHIDLYFEYGVSQMLSLADYVRSQIHDLTFEIFLCNYYLVNRYRQANFGLLDLAENGQCSGQV
jgi:hypothetical protein